MQEIWKDIKGYEGLYRISNLGNVKSLERKVIKSNGIVQIRKERIMNKRKNSDGYYVAKLNVNKMSKSINIHRLVAEAFIPNPLNLPEVNHKDYNRTNNCVDNLEWCSHIDNIKYSSNVGRYARLFGKNNPNYHNDALQRKYQKHPELKQLLARPKAQNGRARKVELYDEDMKLINTFNWIGGCAEYLISHGYTQANVNSIRNNIRISINENRKYLNHYFKFA